MNPEKIINDYRELKKAVAELCHKVEPNARYKPDVDGSDFKYIELPNANGLFEAVWEEYTGCGDTDSFSFYFSAEELTSGEKGVQLWLEHAEREEKERKRKIAEAAALKAREDNEKRVLAEAKKLENDKAEYERLKSIFG